MAKLTLLKQREHRCEMLVFHLFDVLQGFSQQCILLYALQHVAFLLWLIFPLVLFLLAWVIHALTQLPQLLAVFQFTLASADLVSFFLPCIFFSDDPVAFFDRVLVLTAFVAELVRATTDNQTRKQNTLPAPFAGGFIAFSIAFAVLSLLNSANRK